MSEDGNEVWNCNTWYNQNSSLYFFPYAINVCCRCKFIHSLRYWNLYMITDKNLTHWEIIVSIQFFLFIYSKEKMIEVWRKNRSNKKLLHPSMKKSLNLVVMCLSNVISTVSNKFWHWCRCIIYFFLRNTIPIYLYCTSRCRQSLWWEINVYFFISSNNFWIMEIKFEFYLYHSIR